MAQHWQDVPLWPYRQCPQRLLEHWGLDRLELWRSFSLFVFPAVYQVSLWLCRNEGKNSFHDGRCLLAGTQLSDTGEGKVLSRLSNSAFSREIFTAVLPCYSTWKTSLSLSLPFPFLSLSLLIFLSFLLFLFIICFSFSLSRTIILYLSFLIWAFWIFHCFFFLLVFTCGSPYTYCLILLLFELYKNGIKLYDVSSNLLFLSVLSL